MSGSVNKVILIGNLGEDPRTHQFENSNVITRFPIATSESYTRKDTQDKVVHTEWHTVVCRNKLAEICDKYLNKGDKVFVEGKLKTRKWEDDSGKTRYNTEVIADNVQFLSTKKSEGSFEEEEKDSTKEEKDLPF